MKSFLTPLTGKIVEYPDHFAELKPYLVEVLDSGPCVDCGSIFEEARSLFLSPSSWLNQRKRVRAKDSRMSFYAKLGAMTSTTHSIGGADK